MSTIKFLGAYGGRGSGQNTTCVQLSERVTIDAGNILNPLGEDANTIDHIFLSHCHLDHIIDIPFLIDAFFVRRKAPLNIYALPETIASLKQHILNWNIWPNFNDIDLIGQKEKSIQFVPITCGETYHVDGLSLKPVATNHTVPSCGYVVEKEGKKVLLTLDTHINDTVWEEINRDCDINTLVIEVSFPSRMAKLAEASRHMTPLLLQDELKKITREEPLCIYVNHMKPDLVDEIRRELQELDLPVVMLHDGYTITL